MNTYRVAITCVGGHYAYDLIFALKAAEEFHIEVIGVDANADAYGRLFVDHFEVVPIAEQDEGNYIERMLALCKKYQIDVLIQGSEGETRVIAKYCERFEKAGIQTAVNTLAMVEVMTDKLKMLTYLQKNGIEVGPFVAVQSLEDAARALDALEYTKSPVVFKQRKGSGSRGVLIADNQEKEFRPLLTTRFCGRGNFESIIEAMRTQGVTFEDYFAMPYYGGAVYDIDCLGQQGRAVVIVPRLRQYANPLSPVNEGCKIMRNERVLNYVESLCRVFAVNGACDFDIALTQEGAPRILDASSRMSGSVGAAYAAGVNVPAQLVRILLDLPLQSYRLIEGAELRPVNHIVKL